MQRGGLAVGYGRRSLQVSECAWKRRPELDYLSTAFVSQVSLSELLYANPTALIAPSNKYYRCDVLLNIDINR